MSCTLRDFKQDAIAKAMYEFKGDSNATSLQKSPNEANTYLITYGNQSKTVKTQGNAYNMALSYAKRVEDWATKKFGKKFSKGWTQISSGYNNIKITFDVPNYLMKVQEIKRAEKSKQAEMLRDLNAQAQELLDADNRRAGGPYEENGIIYKQTESSSEARNKAIEEKLNTFLNEQGISVEYVNSLKERGYDAVAIADITNKLILISKNEADISTLPEEVAHFAVELLGENNPIVKRLMDLVEDTEIYNETFEEYKTDEEYQLNGSPDVKKIKKEAIGKAIAQEIIKDGQLDETSAFKRTLKKLWNKVTSLFKRVDNKALNEEFNKLANRVSTDILENTLEADESNLKGGVFKSKSTKKQVSKEEARARKAIKTLEARLKQIKTKEGAASSLGIKQSISAIQNFIDANQSLLGISTYLNAVSEGIISIDEKIKSLKDSGTSFTNDISILKDIFEFTDLHGTMVNDIYKMFEEDTYLQERGEGLYEQIEESVKIINRARNFVEANMKEATKITVDQYSNNPDLAETLFEDGAKDTSFFSTYLNTYKNSKAEIIALLDKLLRDIKNNVRRYTLQKGKALIDKQIAAERSGFKDFSKLAERDSNGKLTGNIIREVNYGAYRQARIDFKEKLYKDLKIKKGDKLTATQQSAYQKAWTKFHKENSVYVKGGQGFVPNSKYKNKVFTEIMSNPKVKEYYDALIEQRQESIDKLPDNYNTKDLLYQLPQIRKNTLQRIRSKEASLWSNLTGTIREDLSEAFKVKEDDTEFGHAGGEVTLNPITGEEIRFIPIHFTGRLKNMDDISLDFTATSIAFTEMAETYKQRTLKQGEVWLIEEAVNNQTFTGSRAANKGASNLQKTLSNLVETHFYGKEKHLTKYEYVGKFTGKKREINVTKIVDRFLKYVRNNNLAGNIFTHLTNHVMGAAYSKYEGIAGRYTTLESQRRSEIEFDKNLLSIMSEVGKRNKKNKINVMLEYNGIVHDGRKMFKNLDVKNGIGRTLANSGLLSTYEISDTRIKGKALIAIYDNYRLFEDNFISYKEFKTLHKGLDKKEIKAKWKTLSDKTLYDAYEAKDGLLKPKKEFEQYIADNIENKIAGILEHSLNAIDGQLSENDLTEIHRYALGRAVMTHRNWMVAGLEDRFKSAKYNYVTDEHDEGFYRTFTRTLMQSFKRNDEGNFDVENLKSSMKALILSSKDMSEEDKANIKKVYADMTFIFLTMAVAALLNGMADDRPDDYLAQFNGYLSTRIRLEASALDPFSIKAPFQLLDIVKSPAAGVNQFESLADGIYMLTYEGTAFDEVRSGGYKGKTKLEQLAIKRSILKPFYEISNIESIKGKNRYTRMMGL